MNTRILVVEDEIQMGRLLHTSLSARGYDVLVATDGHKAVDLVARWSPDVILLDLGLPSMDGLEVCQRVRGWSDVPIIVLTVRKEDRDKVSALDLGADDYVTKPFSMNELLARIRVALRHAHRPPPLEDAILDLGELRLDLARRVLTVRGQEVHVTPKEYNLLRVLVTNADKVLTHQMLLREAWGSAYEQDVPTLRVFITQLRQKIEADSAHPTQIVTVLGVGYRFRVNTNAETG